MKGKNLDRGFFNRCWNKESPKFRQRLCQKLMNKGVEPTYNNCKSYWFGSIKPYKHPKTGSVEHLHIKVIRKRRRIYGPTRPMENQNRNKKRRFN